MCEPPLHTWSTGSSTPSLQYKHTATQCMPLLLLAAVPQGVSTILDQVRSPSLPYAALFDLPITTYFMWVYPNYSQPYQDTYEFTAYLLQKYQGTGRARAAKAMLRTCGLQLQKALDWHGVKITDVRYNCRFDQTGMV